MHRAMMRLAGFGLNCQTARALGLSIRALKENVWHLRHPRRHEPTPSRSRGALRPSFGSRPRPFFREGARNAGRMVRPQPHARSK